MPILDEGLDVAEATADEIKASRASGYLRPRTLPIKDGETHYLRFLTPHTATLGGQCHQYIPTKDKPEGVTWTWPKAMWAICQNEKMYRLRDEAGNLTDAFEEGYGNCYICRAYKGVKDDKFGHDKSRPTYVVHGLAVVRKAAKSPDGKRITGFSDETVEYRVPEDFPGLKDGENFPGLKAGDLLQVPRIVIAAQRYEPFWHPLAATAYAPPYTILDKDYVVTRKGNKDDGWNVVPLTQTPDTLAPGKPAWKRYEQALLIMGGGEKPFSLREWFLDNGTSDHYAKFFDPDRVPEGGYGRDRDGAAGEEGGDAAAVPADDTTPVDEAAMDRFRASLSGRGKPADTDS
ncbi:MAG: hypothetical protein JWM19_856 [Actinomycetia bacterium]|nr:hypothetical protein [Actinomycetes bacterium]